MRIFAEKREHRRHNELIRFYLLDLHPNVSVYANAKSKTRFVWLGKQIAEMILSAFKNLRDAADIAGNERLLELRTDGEKVKNRVVDRRLRWLWIGCDLSESFNGIIKHSMNAVVWMKFKSAVRRL